MAAAATARVRDARPDEAQELSDLALRSKAHWGYGRDFLEACRPALTLSPDDVRRDEVGALELEGRLVGFHRISGEPPEGELADLWVDPDFIGRGLGLELVRDACRRARAHGFRSLVVESDPHAEGFYVRLGAVRIGERESSVAGGRCLPLLRLEVEG